MDNTAMKKIALKAAVFGVVSIAVMLQRSATKHIMITEASGVTVDRGTSGDAYKLLVNRDTGASGKGKLIIPLSKSVSSDDIVLEDGYMDRELMIHIDSREDGFYMDSAVTTDLDIFDSAICYNENESGKVRLDFKLKDFYVNESTLTESSTIEIEFAKPSQKYDKIVLVNPVGGTDAVDAVSSKASVDVALALKSIAEKDSDNNIRFFFTRTSDIDVDEQKRVEAIRACEADLVVEIATQDEASTETEGIRCGYNDVFFTNRLTNAEFADIIEKNCARKTGAKAIGLFPTDAKDRFIAESTVPGARIEVGRSGSRTLESSGYKKKIAEGIYDAVLEAFEEME